MTATALSAGDIAIVGFNFDDPDEFAFVALVDIGAGTEISFTDNGWQAAGGFRSFEGTFTWTAPADIAAGTVIAPAVSSVAFSASGDQIIAYQGPASAPTLIYALNSEGSGVWQADSTTSNTSALPNGLVNGQTAIALNESDNAIYTGAKSGERAALLAAISDPANWTGSDTVRQDLASFGAFSVSAAPPLVINEVLADPSSDPVLGDANGDGTRNASDDEFVEIVNTSDAAVDLSGMTLSDGVGARHIFADGTSLAAGAAIVVFGGGTPTGLFGGATVVTASSGSLGLNNGGDTVTLATADGAVLDTFVYDSAAPTDQSLTRDPDLTGPFVGHTGATGSGGAPFSPGTQVNGDPFAVPAPQPTVLNEVFVSHTGLDDTEFVEIFGEAGTSLDGLSFIGIEGDDGSSIGTIDARFDFDASHVIGDNGFFLLGNPAGLANNYSVSPNAEIASNVLENGSATYALVETASLSGTAVSGSEVVIDSVALTEGRAGDTFFFGAPIVGPEGAFLPAGARRIVDGVDTDSAADWAISDFFLGPENTPTAGTGDGGGQPTLPTRISEIQGAGDASPLVGQTVTVEAIVVGDFQDSVGANGDLNGFFLQEEDADADGDAATSEGIFVFDGSNPDLDVAVGDLVRVTGTADEFFGMTQIDTVTAIEIVSSGNALPTPGVLDLPAGDDAREALEGMLVTIPDKAFITEYFNYDRFGEIVVSVDDPATNQPGTDGRLDQFTQFNAPDVAGFAAYQEAIAARRITIDDGRTGQNPDPALLPDGTEFTQENGFRGGDTLENFTGVLNYAFDLYRLQPVADLFPNAITSENPRPDAPDDVGGSLKVASLNVLNFFTTLDNGVDDISGPDQNLEPRGADDQEEFDRQLEKLLTALNGIDADILGLVELENEFGGDQNGDGKFAIDSLVTAYNAKYGANYAFVDPGVNFVGGDAIAVGFIYDTQTVELTPGTTVAQLTDDDLVSLGLTGPIFEGPGSNRVPLAATFTEKASGESFTAAVNHFKSKGSPGPNGDVDIGDGQGNANGIRTKAAEALNAWLATDPTGSGDADFMILGDLNAYAMEDPVMLLKDAGYTDLVDRFVGPEAYSFVFDGQFGTLDYALASESLLGQVTGATEWRVNSDEPDIIDYDTSFKQDAQDALFDGTIPFRNSDHDPIIVGLDLTPTAPDTVVARVEFVNQRWGDRAIYSLDGEIVDVERVRLLQKRVEIEEAGLTIDADDGRFWSPEFVTTLGNGIGVRSAFGDRFWQREKKVVDDDETLGFALEDIAGAGDARDVAFEFAMVRGRGEAALTFFEDGAVVAETTADISGRALAYELAGVQTFDHVEIGVTGSLTFTVKAVEFGRVVLDDGLALA